MYKHIKASPLLEVTHIQSVFSEIWCIQISLKTDCICVTSSKGLAGLESQKWGLKRLQGPNSHLSRSVIPLLKHSI